MGGINISALWKILSTQKPRDFHGGLAEREGASDGKPEAGNLVVEFQE
jgi:hypothetical protein